MFLRVFTSFSGYDSLCLALQRLAEDSFYLERKNGKLYGGERFEFELVGWSEIDKYAIQAHNALFPQWADRNFGDISKIDWSEVPDFDLFTYSSPCQDFSQAGKQAGGEKGSGTRSSLLWECERAIATKRPRYLLMENVAALVSKKFIRLFNQWQLTLERYGYRNFAKVLNAKDYGVPQHRKRIFLVSVHEDKYKGDLYHSELEKGNMFVDWDEIQPPRYEFPKPFVLEKRLKDVLESNVDEKYYLKDARLAGLLNSTAKEKEKGNCFKFAPKSGEDIAGTILTRPKDRKTDNYIKEPIVLGWIRGDKGEVVNRHPVEVANCVTSAKRDNTQNYVVEPINTDNDGCARTINCHYQDMNAESVMSKSRNGYGYVRTGVVEIDGAYYRIRKLTPRECFRLMDVSDTDIDKIQAAGISNSQQYKMAGNSIVVSCLYHIFDKLFINTEQSELTLF